MSGETNETSETKVEDPPRPDSVKPYCPVTVEPVIFLVSMAGLIMGTLRPQYIYYRLGNATVNEEGSSCYGNSSNSSDYEERQDDQAEAIQWATALELAFLVPSLVVTVLIGSVSDKLGRKLNLIIPLSGLLLQSILGALVVQLNLPLAVFIPAAFIGGLTGGGDTLFGGCFAYISDITAEGPSRYFRHAILQTILGIGLIASSLTAGFWFEQLGFPLGISQPFWFAVGLFAFCLLYTIFALQETCPKKPGTQLCALSNITGIVQLFKVKRKTPTWALGVLCLTSFVLSSFEEFEILLTYVIGPPFCWPPNFVGYYQIASGARAVVSLVAIKLLSNYPFALMTVGYISGIGSLTLLGLAAYAPNRDVAIFMAPAVGCFLPSTYIVLRTTMSKMVGQDEQGSLFGLLNFTTSLSAVVFFPFWNFVFARTIPIMPGMVFLLFAGVTLIAAVLTGTVKFNLPESVEENLVDEDKEEHDTKL